ncbi:MAG: hypothetical protein DRH97_03125 [Chloroflexi bacterium]|nr:MAG: hypothetical protein DRH97_03125 [Chloroflexota bacterium]
MGRSSICLAVNGVFLLKWPGFSPGGSAEFTPRGTGGSPCPGTHTRPGELCGLSGGFWGCLVPYRILLPQNTENLLVAGRCVSSKRDAIPTTRQMMCCSLTGQAAGIAAALSVRESRSPREVGIDKLQKAIRDQGVRME